MPFLNVELKLYVSSWSWQLFVQLLYFTSCDSQYKVNIYLFTQIQWMIEDLVIAFMMLLIAHLMAESATSRQPRVRSVHNSSLQGNAWLIEMLNSNSPVRCRGLLQMQRHVFIRLWEIENQKLLERLAIREWIQTSHNVSANDRAQLSQYSHSRCISTL